MAEAMDTHAASCTTSESAGPADPSSKSEPATLSTKTHPVCLIVLGMAGSGKTSLVQRLTSDLNILNKPPYVINLDPACHDLPYPANIGLCNKIVHVMMTVKLPCSLFDVVHDSEA
jgi:polynucleotide 5'-kinase involved in rRNA processing